MDGGPTSDCFLILPPRPTCPPSLPRPREAKARDGPDEEGVARESDRPANEVDGKAGRRQPGTNHGGSDSPRRNTRLNDAVRLRWLGWGVQEMQGGIHSPHVLRERGQGNEPVSVEELLSVCSARPADKEQTSK